MRGVAPRQVSFFCFAKRKTPKKRRPTTPALRAAQKWGLFFGLSDNSFGELALRLRLLLCRQTQTIRQDIPKK